MHPAMITRCTYGLLAAAAVFRIYILFSVPSVPTLPAVSTSDRHLQRFRFDADALVVIRPGPDNAPGILGIDDGGNGTTDEPGELGATGSDDECLVLFGAETQEAAKDPMTLILQKGAFRPVRDGEMVTDGVSTRTLVSGTKEWPRSREMMIE